jgi:hypothetical protein
MKKDCLSWEHLGIFSHDQDNVKRYENILSIMNYEIDGSFDIAERLFQTKNGWI